MLLYTKCKELQQKLKLFRDRCISVLSLEDDVRDDSKLLENLRTIGERSLPHEPKWVNGSNLIRDTCHR